MPGVITKRNRPSVFAADSSLCAQDEILIAQQLLRIPAHAGVLGEAEQIAARLRAQHLLGNRQSARRTSGAGLDVGNHGLGTAQEFVQSRGHAVLFLTSDLSEK